MIEIKITENAERNEYMLEPYSGILGARYDNLSDEIKVIFPQKEIDNESSCVMIITNDSTEIDCVTVRHDEIFKLKSPMSNFKQVFIGFSFQKPDGYIKNSNIGLFYFRDAQNPDAGVPIEPTQREKINLLLADGFAGVDWAEDNPSILEFKDVDGEVVKRLDISGGGFASKEELNEVLKEANDYTDKELAKFDFIKIVQELPETGLPNRFYFVFKQDGESPDLFDEFVWVNKGTDESPEFGWEYLGTKKIEIDLTEYVKFTDYATEEKAGVIKAKKNAPVGINANGVLGISPATEYLINLREYYNILSPYFIDYATMSALADCRKPELWTDDTTDENGETVQGTKSKARELLGAVGRTYVNDLGKTGLVTLRPYRAGGIGVVNSENGLIEIIPATNERIAERNTTPNPITPSNLDYAVKEALVNTKETWTAKEKETVRELFSVGKIYDAFGIKYNAGQGSYWQIVPATNDNIEKKDSKYKPITPQNLDFAIKVGLTTNTETLTDEEKAKASAWLGVTALIENLQAQIDELKKQ